MLSNTTASELKIIASTSFKIGRFADYGSGGSYVYRSSKAALKMVMASVILHPGWVRTDMDGPSGETSVAESVTAMKKTLSPNCSLQF